MFQEKVKAALRLLSANSRGQVLDLNERFPASQSDSESVSVREILKQKHPDAWPVTTDALVTSEPPLCHPVIYDNITGSTIRAAALQCQGAAGQGTLLPLSQSTQLYKCVPGVSWGGQRGKKSHTGGA